MTMQPPPKGDPPFLIEAPTNGSILGPTFSVNGSGPPNMTNINATVGNSSQPAMQQPNNCWEAIFTGMASGTGVAVSASSSAGGATPGGITVTIDADPGITIGTVTPPPGPMMDAAGAPQTNPWSGWKITGMYNPALIKKVWIYLTHKGEDVKVSGNKAWGEATLDSNGLKWSCDLGFVPPGFRGNGFLIHYNAHRLNDQIVHGTITTFFNGPPAGA